MLRLPLLKVKTTIDVKQYKILNTLENTQDGLLKKLETPWTKVLPLRSDKRFTNNELKKVSMLSIQMMHKMLRLRTLRLGLEEISKKAMI